MKVFIVGVAGGVGRLVAEKLVAAGQEVGGLVRGEKQQIELAEQNIKASVGDLTEMTEMDLALGMKGFDAIVFSAGAGGKDKDEMTTKVDGDGPQKIAAAAEVAGIKRFLLVSVFPEAWRDRGMDSSFEHYIAEKKRAEINLVQTDLDWLILRPSALTDNPGTGHIDLGVAMLHTTIPRDDVATTIVALLNCPESRRILELSEGSTSIPEAINALSHKARSG